VEAARLEHLRVGEPAQPAVAAQRIRVIVEVAEGGKRLCPVEVPLLDLVMGTFDVGAKAVEIFAKALDRPGRGL
jgi:hypothetical protein